jgi:hypothetical protein
LDVQNGFFEIWDSELQDALREHINQYAKTTAYSIYRLAREDLGHQFLNPLLIGLRSSRVPPVQAIELQQYEPSVVKTDVDKQ